MTRGAASLGAGLACALLSSAPAAGAPPLGAAAGPTPAQRLAQHLLESPRLIDPLERGRLELYGVTFQLFYDEFLAWKPRGGAKSSDTTGHNGSFDFFTQVDGGELLGWPGLGALLHLRGAYDDTLNWDVRALSDPIDDADYDEGTYVSQLWLEQAIFDDRVRLRAGLMEQQTLYDRNAFANSEDRQFLTTFLDNDPLVPLPHALGAALIVTPWPWIDLAAGVADADNTPRRAGFDTAFDGASSLNVYFEATARVALPVGEQPLPGNVRVGFFRDGRRRPVFGRTDARGNPVTQRGHLGAYLSLDQVLTRERSLGEQGLGVFGRFGYADGDTSSIEWFWSLGGEYVGLLPGRDRDVLGVGGYQALASDRFRSRVNSAFDGEKGVEVYYRVAVLPWLAVTPDFQYVIDPGGFGNASDAVVCVLRFRVTF